jgi:hypothetical protein
VNASAKTGRFDPAQVERWLEVSRAYLTAPLAELRPECAVEDRTHRLVPQIRGDRSVLLSWAHRALLHLLKRATQIEDNPLKALESGLYFHASLMAKYPSVPATIMAWYLHTPDTRIRLRIRGVIVQYENRLSRLINRAKQQGLVRSGVDAQAAANVLVGLIQGLALRMNAGICQPEMLLREAASVFSGYLDGICATAEPFTTECLCQGTGMS